MPAITAKIVILIEQPAYSKTLSMVKESVADSSGLSKRIIQEEKGESMLDLNSDNTNAEKNPSQQFLKELTEKYGYSIEKISEYCRVSKRVVRNILRGETSNLRSAAFQRLLGFYCQVRGAGVSCLDEAGQ